jgi:hypothetical protein
MMFGYDRQDIIKYKKIYFIINMYYCQTYIFEKKNWILFFYLVYIEF